jgi:hypothetical protein
LEERQKRDLASVCAIPDNIGFLPNSWLKRRTKIQSIRHTELYSERDDFAVMTRTAVLNDAQLARIADHLRRNAEDLADSTNPPAIDDCRIAGAMLGWAFTIAPIRIVAKFDY